MLNANFSKFDHELKDETFLKYKTWFKKSTGIDFSENKKSFLKRRLGKRLRDLNIVSFNDYFYLLKKECRGVSDSDCEKQIAIDLLTTNETYFFREQAHFDFVREVCIPQWKGRHIRCLSAASSTGEEAYSLGFTLAENHSDAWSIEGVDISSRAVMKAKSGVYPIESSEKIKRKYLINFCKKGVGKQACNFKISENIHKNIKFHNFNLLDDISFNKPFDIIFLRNILIYFNQESKKCVIDNILRYLKVGGYLIIGHSDSLNGIETGLVMLEPSIFFREK